MKNPTIFLDLDGLLVVNSGLGASIQWYTTATPVDGAIHLLDEFEKRGWYVIITTARKECTREDTVAVLRTLRVHYDQLIMGITSGLRVVMNDSKPGLDLNDRPTCTAAAITCRRNQPIDVDMIVKAIEQGQEGLL